jgi:hypothetical protein
MKQHPSTAYHPQTNGQTERVNQEVEKYIRAYVDYLQKDWAEWIDMAEFSLNDKKHSSTGFTPFYINYGQHPWKGEPRHFDVKKQAAKEDADKFQEIRKTTQKALERAAESMKRQHDKKARPSANFNEGDFVYLSSENFKTPASLGLVDKFKPRRYGPLKILKKVGPAAYKLELPAAWPSVHPVFNEQYLTKARKPKFAIQQSPPPPPPIYDENEEASYEVERILASKRRTRRTRTIPCQVGRL